MTMGYREDNGTIVLQTMGLLFPGPLGPQSLEGCNLPCVLDQKQRSIVTSSLGETQFLDVCDPLGVVGSIVSRSIGTLVP